MQAEPTAPARRRAPLVPVFLGFALALPFLPLFQHAPGRRLRPAGAAAGVHGRHLLGAALNGGRRGRVVFECAFATLMIVFGLLALFWSPLWLALGFALHGVWDLVHHTGVVEHGVRRWFPPFCAAWDWIIAAMIVFFS